jgi:hypothetical protein
VFNSSKIPILTVFAMMFLFFSTANAKSRVISEKDIPQIKCDKLVYYSPKYGYACAPGSNYIDTVPLANQEPIWNPVTTKNENRIWQCAEPIPDEMQDSIEQATIELLEYLLKGKYQLSSERYEISFQPDSLTPGQGYLTITHATDKGDLKLYERLHCSFVDISNIAESEKALTKKIPDICEDSRIDSYEARYLKKDAKSLLENTQSSIGILSTILVSNQCLSDEQMENPFVFYYDRDGGLIDYPELPVE